MANSSSPSLPFVARATAIGALYPIAVLLELALFRTSVLYAVGCSMGTRLGYLIAASAPVMVAYTLAALSFTIHYTQTVLVDSTIQLLDYLYHTTPQFLFQTAPKFILTTVYRIPDHLHLLFLRLPKQVAVEIIPELIKECLCFAGLVALCMLVSQSVLEDEEDEASSQGQVLLKMGTSRVEPDPGACADMESDSCPDITRSPPKKKNTRVHHRSRKTSQTTVPPEHVSSSEAGVSEDVPKRFTQLPPTPSSSPTRMTVRRSSPNVPRQRRTSQPQQNQPVQSEEKVPSNRKPSLPTPPPTPSAALMPKTPTAPISRLIRSRTDPTSQPDARSTRLSAQERYSPAVPLLSVQTLGGRRRSTTSGGRSRRGSFLHSANAPATVISDDVDESPSDSTDSLHLGSPDCPKTLVPAPSAASPKPCVVEAVVTEKKVVNVPPALDEEEEVPPTPVEGGVTRASPEREGSPLEDSALPPSWQQPASRLKASHLRIHKPRRRESVSSSSGPFKATNASSRAKLPDSRVGRRRAEMIFRRKMSDNMALDNQAELALSEEGEPMEIGTPRINTQPFLLIPAATLVPRASTASLSSLTSPDGDIASDDETEMDTDIRMSMSATFPPSPSVSPTASPGSSVASPSSASILDIDMLDRFSPHPDKPSSATSSPLSSAPSSPAPISPKTKTPKKGPAPSSKKGRSSPKMRAASSSSSSESSSDEDSAPPSPKAKEKGKGKAKATVFEDSDDESSPAVSRKPSRKASPREIPPLPAMSSPIQPTAELLEQIRMEVERTKDIPLPVDDSDLGEEEEEEGEIREDTDDKNKSKDDGQGDDADDEDAHISSDSQRTASRHSTPLYTHHRRHSSTPLSSPLRTPSPPCGRMLFRRRRGYTLPPAAEVSPSILGKRPREDEEDDDDDNAPLPPARKRRCWSEEI